MVLSPATPGNRSKLKCPLWTVFGSRQQADYFSFFFSVTGVQTVEHTRLTGIQKFGNTNARMQKF